MYSDADLETDPFDDTIFTRSRAKVNHPFPLVESPYNVKPSIDSTITKEEKDTEFDETLTSEFKVECDNFAGPSTPTSSVNSKEKLKLISEAQTQNMGCDSSLKKTSKSLQPKERAGSAGKGTAPKVLSTSSKPGRGEKTTSVTSSPSKKGDEKDKSAISSSSTIPSLKENIVLDAALLGSKRTLAIDDEISPSIPAESQEFAVQKNGTEPPGSKDNKDGKKSRSPTAKENDLAG